jgi:hypothetical protein
MRYLNLNKEKYYFPSTILVQKYGDGQSRQVVMFPCKSRCLEIHPKSSKVSKIIP